MVGTPAGGTLYARFGFRGPFVFGEICTAVDLILRLLIIERDVALRWGYDPATRKYVNATTNLESSSSSHPPDVISTSAPNLTPVHSMEQAVSLDSSQKQNALDSHPSSSNNLTIPEVSLARKPLPILTVIGILAHNPRAVVALTMSLVYGYVLCDSH